MKTLLVVAVAFWTWTWGTAGAQEGVAEWQTKAVEAYPDLSVPGSPLNKTFLQLRQQLRESTPQLFDNPKWPLLIAQLVGGDPKPITPAPPFFIVVTTETHWADGLTSPAGEVERVLAIENDSYALWNPSGKPYWLPKERAQVISDADASVRLLAQRQSLYGQLSQIYAKVIAAAQQQAQGAQSQVVADQNKQALELILMLQALANGQSAKGPTPSGQGPTQYNGRPLPRNWIDPAQADANFNAQQLKNSMDRQTQELQRLQQELQNRRR